VQIPRPPGHFQVEQRLGYFTAFNPPAPAPKYERDLGKSASDELGGDILRLRHIETMRIRLSIRLVMLTY